MINGKKICVVMLAYNAEKILKKTYDETPKDIDDASSISFRRSVTYGMGVMQTAVKYAMAKRRMDISRYSIQTAKSCAVSRRRQQKTLILHLDQA